MSSSLRYQDATKYEHMAVSGTYISRSGRAVLHSVIVNDRGGITDATVYDNNMASGDIVTSINVAAVTIGGVFDYGVVLNNGLTVTINGTGSITVIYE